MNKIFISILVIMSLNLKAQSPIDETAIPPTGISYQNGPGGGNAQNWTYVYGAKLSVFGNTYRNFEIMNTQKTGNSTLALRTYDGGSSSWTPWREFLFRDHNDYLIFPVKSFYSKAQTNFDGDLLLKSGNTAGINNYGASISFTKIAGGTNKRASIVSKQTGSDQDNVGLSFFTHGNTAANDLVERMFIDGSGNVGIGVPSTTSRLDISKQGDGAELLRLSTERPWVFRQTNTGSISQLDLHSTVGDKNFKITSPNSTRVVQFFVSDATNNSRVFLVPDGGKVGIGTTSFGSHSLAVEGSIGAREIKVEASSWSDFVFESEYELRTLEEVEQHIAEKGHLPEIPSEAEVTENGINLGEMDAKLLRKIEELTLYLIEQNKRMNKLEAKNAKLEKEISTLKNE